MTLPDFMAYKDKFTQRAFVEKISHVAKACRCQDFYCGVQYHYTCGGGGVQIFLLNRGIWVVGFNDAALLGFNDALR